MIVIDLMEEDAGYEVLSASPFRATKNPVAASFAQNKMHSSLGGSLRDPH